MNFFLTKSRDGYFGDVRRWFILTRSEKRRVDELGTTDHKECSSLRNRARGLRGSGVIEGGIQRIIGHPLFDSSELTFRLLLLKLFCSDSTWGSKTSMNFHAGKLPLIDEVES